MEFRTLTPVHAYRELQNQGNGDAQRGEVRPGFYDDDGQRRTLPCVCMQKYGMWSWEPLSQLSGARWVGSREAITASLKKSFNLLRPQHMAHYQTEIKIKNESMTILKDLYERLGPDDKLALRQKYKTTFLGKILCTACLQFCDKITSCIHPDCSGICQGCLAKSAEVCKGCGKKQEKECPICQDIKPTEDLMPSQSCKHSVCHKCYAMAFKSGHPIWTCPLCRQEFTKILKTHAKRHLHFDSDNDSIDSDSDSDSEGEWENPAGFAGADIFYTEVWSSAAISASTGGGGGSN
jgi:hypothetical protein